MGGIWNLDMRLAVALPGRRAFPDPSLLALFYFFICFILFFKFFVVFSASVSVYILAGTTSPTLLSLGLYSEKLPWAN